MLSALDAFLVLVWQTWRAFGNSIMMNGDDGEMRDRIVVVLLSESVDVLVLESSVQVIT